MRVRRAVVGRKKHLRRREIRDYTLGKRKRRVPVPWNVQRHSFSSKGGLQGKGGRGGRNSQWENETF